MSASTIENMFDLYRFQNQQDFPKVLLYFPFGFTLLLFRLAVLLLTWPFLALLPTASVIRSVLLKGMCRLFGIFIKKDGRNQDKGVKLLVCNHISILDHIAVESVLSCRQVNICSHICSEWNFRASYSHAGRNSSNGEVSRDKLTILQHCIDVSDVPVLVFPEGATTNGKYGLLKFNTSVFDMTSLVQPVVIQMADSSFINISPSVIGASDWCDLLWLLFVPYTVFMLRILPLMYKVDTESSESFSRRVQNVMASSLNLASTEYTSTNKAEFAKKLNIPSAAAAQPEASHSHSSFKQSGIPEINRMAEQVKEVLPHVPIAVILQDLRVTKNLDDTIFRLIEGVVQFVPESSSSASSSAVSKNRITVQSSEQALPPLNTAAGSFGKTPKDRMLSYQERKMALLNSARMCYLKKHNLL